MESIQLCWNFDTKSQSVEECLLWDLEQALLMGTMLCTMLCDTSQSPARLMRTMLCDTSQSPDRLGKARWTNSVLHKNALIDHQYREFPAGVQHGVYG